MLKLVIVGTIMAYVQATMKHPVNADMVAEIKAKTNSWIPMEAHKNPLGKLEVNELYSLLGGKFDPDLDVDEFSTVEVGDYPDAFDSREKWPKYINKIRDQGQCGSCWAFGATEALSDRFAIFSKGAVSPILSPQDLVACDKTDYGCNGGYIQNAWVYLEKSGAVSEDCFPYTSGTSGVNGPCETKCANGDAWKKYKCKAGSRVLAATPDQIKTEIFANGPMETRFDVYQDFFSYSSGVYQHVSGGLAGGHAIKILGWGNENGLDYWLCANSWGTGWGLKGFFKIEVGQCGIAQANIGCTPDLSAFEIEETQ